jgi:hypothetical protein
MPSISACCRGFGRRTSGIPHTTAPIRPSRSGQISSDRFQASPQITVTPGKVAASTSAISGTISTTVNRAGGMPASSRALVIAPVPAPSSTTGPPAAIRRAAAATSRPSAGEEGTIEPMASGSAAQRRRNRSVRESGEEEGETEVCASACSMEVTSPGSKGKKG